MGGREGGKRSVHVRCKEVLEGHPLQIYVVRTEGAEGRKVMGRGCTYQRRSHWMRRASVCYQGKAIRLRINHVMVARERNTLPPRSGSRLSVLPELFKLAL